MNEISRDKITAEHVRRSAIVFVRQSTSSQVTNNLESRKLQYAMVEKARDFGFARVEVIDDDLGRSGSGLQARPGFDALVGAVCTSEVGAVFSVEDARLARNGRQWHHLIDLCALAGTLLIDPNGIYDPRLVNDRLLLGLKGSMAEYELNLILQRSRSAIQAKAKRGELRIPLPVGLRWKEEGGIEPDPDQRVQRAIRTVFQKHKELGSVRQVLLWFRHEKLMLPTFMHDRRCLVASWRLPSYHAIHGILTNPMYAGAYAFGRREVRIQLVDGVPHKSGGHMKTRDRWSVLIREHHPGYISWEEFDQHQAMLADNAYSLSNGTPKAGRGGHSLLAGLLRCQRCGAMLSVMYKGSTNRVPRYVCHGAHINRGDERCISFGGLRPDEAVAQELMRALESHAVEAALHAHELLLKQGDERAEALRLELEQARYEAQLASRRYEEVDPTKRLVAAELEARWNTALERVEQLKRELEHPRKESACPISVPRDALLALAEDLPAMWNAADADMRIKQRIVRLLIHEVVADVDRDTNEIRLVIHWQGGRHSETRMPKNKAGHTSRWTDPDAAKVIRSMAGGWSDRDIALTLNRLRLRTGTGKSWTQTRVAAVRHRMALAPYDPDCSERLWLSMEQAATYLGVSATTVRRLIQHGTIAATQTCPGAPWQLRREDLDSPKVKCALKESKRRSRRSRTSSRETQTLRISGL